MTGAWSGSRPATWPGRRCCGWGSGWRWRSDVAALPFMSWPILAGDDLLAYQTGFWSAAGPLLAGAWLGLRDRASGAADLVAVTPTAPWRLWGPGWPPSRWSPPACSRSRSPPPWPSRPSAAAAAPRSPAAGRRGPGGGAWRLGRRGRRPAQRLAHGVGAGRPGVGGRPADGGAGRRCRRAAWRCSACRRLLTFTERPVGRVRLPARPALAAPGLPARAGAARRRRAAGPGRPRRRPAPAPGAGAGRRLAGVVLVAAGGRARVILPSRTGWWCWGRTGPTGSPPARSRPRVDDRPWSYPDDGHARSCAGDATLTACVYPAYGQRLADGSSMAPAAPVAGLFAGLPGVPTRARMVPTQAFATAPAAAARSRSANRGRARVSRNDRDGRSTTSTSTCAARSASATGATAS